MFQKDARFKTGDAVWLSLHPHTTQVVIYLPRFPCGKQCSQVRGVSCFPLLISSAIAPHRERLQTSLPFLQAWTVSGWKWYDLGQDLRSLQVIQNSRIRRHYGAWMKLLTTMWLAITKAGVQIIEPSYTTPPSPWAIYFLKVQLPCASQAEIVSTPSCHFGV